MQMLKEMEKIEKHNLAVYNSLAGPTCSYILAEA